VALVTGEKGQQIRLGGLGDWDTEELSLRGLRAQFDGAGWAIIEPPMLPVNSDPSFSRTTTSNPLPERWMAPAEAAYTIERLADEYGPFVRIRATQPSPYLVVVSPLGRAPAGAPLSARGQIRGQGSGPATLTLFDVDDSGRVQARTASGHLAPDSWHSLIVRGRGLEDRGTSGHVSLGLYSVAPGDWFDLHELSLFAGVLPPDLAELDAG